MAGKRLRTVEKKFPEKKKNKVEATVEVGKKKKKASIKSEYKTFVSRMAKEKKLPTIASDVYPMIDQTINEVVEGIAKSAVETMGPKRQTISVDTLMGAITSYLVSKQVGAKLQTDILNEARRISAAMTASAQE